eukprot:4584028-Karenia_brevis.AAC.1
MHIERFPATAPPGRPFSLVNNGDLWQIFWDIAHARGSASFKVSKTKGHALNDEQYLTANPHLRIEAQHNNEADLLAKEATKRLFDVNV